MSLQLNVVRIVSGKVILSSLTLPILEVLTPGKGPFIQDQAGEFPSSPGVKTLSSHC